MEQSTSPLFSIGHRREPLSRLSALQSGPYVHLFFSLAIISGLFGVSYLGIHLWLMRVGLMEMRPSYLFFRSLHADIQLFFFFGFFVLGFIAQASPKLLGVQRRMSAWCLWALILAPAGFVVEHFFVFPVLGKLLLSGSFLLVLFCLFPLVRQSKGERRRSIGTLFAIGLVSFAIGVWLPVERTEVSLLVFWLALAPCILGAAQQFISGLLDGHYLSVTSLMLVLGTFLLASLFLLQEAYPIIDIAEHSTRWFGLFSLLLVVLYVVGTSARMKIRPWFVGGAFGFSLFWAFLTPILAFFGVVAMDATLHLFALGVGYTLLFAVSLQVLNHLSGRALLPPRISLTFLCAWQLVPLLRCFSWWSDPNLCLVGTSIVSFIHLIWSYVVLKACWRIGVRALTLHKGESLVQC